MRQRCLSLSVGAKEDVIVCVEGGVSTIWRGWSSDGRGFGELSRLWEKNSGYVRGCGKSLMERSEVKLAVY
jgi:hypothetical protein